jgi:putative flippase GtrA
MSWRFARFLLVGGANTVISYSVYVLFLFIGLSYAYASFLSLVIGVLSGFRMQSTLVFKNSDSHLFLRFATCWGGIYIVNITFIHEFLRWGWDPYTAGALALPLIAMISYFVQKNLVFRNRVPVVIADSSNPENPPAP